MAMKISKLLSKVNTCECSRMIEEKGIVVGPKCPLEKKKKGLDTSVYLRQYWQNKVILTNMNSQIFNEEFLAL
jgi:hypothetical protein